MTKEQIISELKKIPVAVTDRSRDKISDAINNAADVIANKIAGSDLKIRKGSSRPSLSRSYVRIYLERGKKNVVREWEWQTQSAGYYHPVSVKSFIGFLGELVKEVSDL